MVPTEIQPVLAGLHSGLGFAVYVALRSFIDSTGKCFPKQIDVAHRAGVSEKTVERIIPKLVAAEVITMTRRNSASGRTSSIYQFIDSPTDSQTVGRSSPTDSQSAPNRLSDGSQPTQTERKKNH